MFYMEIRVISLISEISVKKLFRVNGCIAAIGLRVISVRCWVKLTG